MTYKLKFHPLALKEWSKLGGTVQTQLKKKLAPLLIEPEPEVVASRLRGFENHYKIKLRTSGYRLVYEVINDELVVLVIAVGKRDKSSVYDQAKKRK